MITTLLVYDDDADVARHVAKIATGQDFGAIPVSTEEAFWDAYGAMENGAIALDLVLGKSSGISVLRNLAKAKCAAPILLMSGYHAEILTSARRLGRQFGLDIRGVVKKPFNTADLVEQLLSLRD